MATKSYEQIIDQIGNLSVLELAELVKGLEEKFGVSAAMPMAAAAPAAGAAAAGEPAKAEEKSEYKVTLKDGGPEKIKTIKALRQVTTLGLTEAKKAVEEAPTVIAEAASKADAKKMKETLEAAGAKVELS
jgi:large subunit ribosomal protein L7/L12